MPSAPSRGSGLSRKPAFKVGWPRERDKRAELSATCRRKTSSDHVANDDIERRPVSLKARFTTAESSERCLSTPCSWNQTHRPFHVARQLLETAVIHALATLETPPYHGVCTRWLVGVRAWTLPAAWVKTPRSRGENDAGTSFCVCQPGIIKSQQCFNFPLDCVDRTAESTTTSIPILERLMHSEDHQTLSLRAADPVADDSVWAIIDGGCNSSCHGDMWRQNDEVHRKATAFNGRRNKHIERKAENSQGRYSVRCILVLVSCAVI